MPDRGSKVTVLEMMDDIATDMGMSDKTLLMERLKGKGVKILTQTTVREIQTGRLFVDRKGRSEVLDNFNTFVLAAGYESDQSLEKLLENKITPFYKIGDYAEARKMIEAIHEGFHCAYEL